MLKKSRFRKLEPTATVTQEMVIETWEHLILCAYGNATLTPSHHALLEPFKQKFESGIWALKEDFYPMLDIVY